MPRATAGLLQAHRKEVLSSQVPEWEDVAGMTLAEARAHVTLLRLRADLPAA